MSTEQPSWDRLAAEAGVDIPDPLPPHEFFPSVLIDRGVAYTSGIVAVEGPPLRMAYAGSVGDELSIEEGQASAALAMLRTLGNLKGALGGSLDRIDQFVKFTGFVRCKPDFGQAPLIVNGASELLRTVFGPDRLPARSAIGVAALPSLASVEIEAIVRLRD